MRGLEAVTAVRDEAQTAVEPLPPINLPGGTTLRPGLQGLAFVFLRRPAMHYLRRKYGPSFMVHIPLFGPTMVITEPPLIKQLFQTSTEIISNPEPNLGVVLGEGSLFNLKKEEHHRRRKLLVPPFHGRRMQSYEAIVEEEVLKETASWPEGTEFETLDPMMRITLNIILRTVFGAEGEEFEQLRKLLPPMIELGSRLVGIPFLLKDRGRWSPGGRYRAYRREFDEVIDSLVAKAKADPDLERRQDVLSLLLLARYEDGSAMSRDHLADELLTLLAAGHETTATTLSWAFERLRRHPQVLHRLEREVDEGGSDYLQATIIEVQRTRPVIEATARRIVGERLQLGEWVLPRGHNVIVGIGLVHEEDSVFADASTFDPARFVGVNPDTYAWVPFGGGTRRCVGAAFANMEMNVVLRTILTEFEIRPTYRPAEKWHSRGVAVAPASKGRLVVHRRRTGRHGAAGSAA